MINYRDYAYNSHWIRSVILLSDSRVWKEEGKYKTDKFVLGPRELFSASELNRYVDFRLLSQDQLSEFLVYSSSSGYTKMVKLLLEEGADPRMRHDLALRLTLSAEVRKLLLEAGADPRAIR